MRLFIDSLEAGGSERVCFHLCNRWAEQGLSVELLLLRLTGPFLERLNPKVTVRDFNSSRAWKSFWAVSRYLRTAREVPVLVFGFHLAVGLLAARQLGWHRAPLVYREGSSPRANIKPSRHWAYRWIISSADKVIAQNRSAQRELESLGVPSRKIVLVPNPCSLNGLQRPEPEQRRLVNNPLILAVGRLAPEKGFDRLIGAFARLHRRNPAAQLVILGEGLERHQLTQLIARLGLEGAVSLPGFVADLASWYRKASLFVVSSRYEGQPNALMDAILHECPTLCVQGKGGAADLMEDCGLSRFVVAEAEFEQSFDRHAQDVLTAKPECWVQAREKVLELANPDKVIAQYLAACSVPTANC
jgi:glycosyltransferase involved in cell wall biosynthesis